MASHPYRAPLSDAQPRGRVHRRSALLTLALSVLTAVLATLVGAPVAEAGPKPTELRVGIERDGDLRLLAMWVAIGNGDFRREGLEVVPVALGARVGEALASGEVPIAAMRPELWGPRVATDGDKVAIVAALLRNDACNLVAQKKVAEARGITPSTPLAARLDALRELRVGFVGTSSAHLAGVLGDRAPRVQLVELDEASADRAFAAGDVDAIFAPSPWADRALASADGTLLVHASREDLPDALPLLDAALVSRAFAKGDGARVTAFVRALAAAEQLVHDERASAVHALTEARPGVDRAQLEAAVLLYEPAVPRDPRLDADMVATTLKGAHLDPSKIDVSKIDAAKVVDASFAAAAVKGTPPPARFMKIVGAILGIVIGGVVTFVVLYRKKSEEAADDA